MKDLPTTAKMDLLTAPYADVYNGTITSSDQAWGSEVGPNFWYDAVETVLMEADCGARIPAVPLGQSAGDDAVAEEIAVAVARVRVVRRRRAPAPNRRSSRGVRGWRRHDDRREGRRAREVTAARRRV